MYLQSRNTQMWKTNVWIPRGKRGEWDELGDWDNIYAILCIK